MPPLTVHLCFVLNGRQSGCEDTDTHYCPTCGALFPLSLSLLLPFSACTKTLFRALICGRRSGRCLSCFGVFFVRVWLTRWVEMEVSLGLIFGVEILVCARWGPKVGRDMVRVQFCASASGAVLTWRWCCVTSRFHHVLCRAAGVVFQ